MGRCMRWERLGESLIDQGAVVVVGERVYFLLQLLHSRLRQAQNFVQVHPSAHILPVGVVHQLQSVIELYLSLQKIFGS